MRTDALDYLIGKNFEIIGQSPNYSNKIRINCKQCNMIFDRSVSEFKFKLKHEPNTACPGCNSWWR
ncbi:hypothetical protein D3C74_108660 [compost metagenome]